MMDDSGTLPVPIGAGGNRALSTLDQLAEIPEEDIWLARQKSARTRRAYRLDVQHFIRTLSITTRAELRQADHKAVIAWERYMRETEHAASSGDAVPDHRSLRENASNFKGARNAKAQKSWSSRAEPDAAADPSRSGGDPARRRDPAGQSRRRRRRPSRSADLARDGSCLAHVPS
jgi:hypothetical protein